VVSVSAPRESCIFFPVEVCARGLFSNVTTDILPFLIVASFPLEDAVSGFSLSDFCQVSGLHSAA